MPSYEQLGFGGGAVLDRDRSHAVFGQVMGLVAVTCGFAALGAYLGRNMNGGGGLIIFIGVFACLFGMQYAAKRQREQLAIALLFGMGLLLGLAVAPVLVYYAKTNRDVLYQASVATGGFVAGLGTLGYATRRDLSGFYRYAFWALLALIVFGLIAFFVAIPNFNVIYCVAGLAIFGALVVLDFNRLRRSNIASAPLIAASIFLDVFNIFLFFLSLFGGGGRRN